jgi:hypothetical protein
MYKHGALKRKLSAGRVSRKPSGVSWKEQVDRLKATFEEYEAASIVFWSEKSGQLRESRLRSATVSALIKQEGELMEKSRNIKRIGSLGMVATWANRKVKLVNRTLTICSSRTGDTKSTQTLQHDTIIKEDHTDSTEDFCFQVCVRPYFLREDCSNFEPAPFLVAPIAPFKGVLEHKKANRCAHFRCTNRGGERGMDPQVEACEAI